MKNTTNEREIGKPILFNNKVVSLQLNKDKSISFTDNPNLILDKKELDFFINRLSSINKNTMKFPLDWSETWVRVLLNFFAAMLTLTAMNYIIYLFQKVQLNHFQFMYDLTWIIFMLIPLAIVITHVFSSNSIHKSKYNFLKTSLPKIDLVYFVTAFYNNLNHQNRLSKSEQSLRNAHVVTKDIFDVDGLKMLETDLRSWLKATGSGIKGEH